MIRSTKLRYLLGYFLLSLMVGYSSLGRTADLDLSNTPLFLGDSVDPNVYFELDDSGSMDWDILTRKHWHYCSYDSNALGNTGSGNCGWLVDNGHVRVSAQTATSNNGFEYFDYIFDSDDDAYNTQQDCSSDRVTFELCGAATNSADWRVRSSSVNVMYYDPRAVYRPWVGFTNASFTAARSNPKNGVPANTNGSAAYPANAGYDDTRNLGTDGMGTASAGFTYHVWEDDKGFDTNDDQPRRGTNHNDTNTPNGLVDLWDKHIEYDVTGSTVRYRTITYSPNDAGMNPSTSSWTTLAAAAKDPISDMTPDEIRQNVANWYQYYRRRSFVAKAAIGQVMKQHPRFRYGLSVINDSGRLTVDLPAANITDYTTHNSSLLSDLTAFPWHGHGTPLRRGLEDVGQYYETTGSSAPIIHACQQNFSVLFTDGYWNGGDPAAAIGDSDGDSFSLTLADVANYYYSRDLRSDLVDEVATNGADPAEYQHMVTFTVAFGVTGNLQDQSGDGWPDHTAGGNLFTPAVDANWGDPSADDPQKIDDLWHAAFNSKGKFIAASSPLEVAESLKRSLKEIADRVGSAASVALNSGSLGNDTHVYQAKFDSGEWSGQLLAFLIQPNGGISSTPTWDAREKLRTQLPGDRVILTYNPSTSSGINFAFPSDYQSPATGEMSADQVTKLLTVAPFSAVASPSAAEIAVNQHYGEALVNYLRGAQSQEEGVNGAVYDFRNRGAGVDRHILGDAVHSDPVFVGAPNFRYPDIWRDRLDPAGTTNPLPENDGSAPTYSSFATGPAASRIPMIYFGANDGMLHGVNATDLDDATTDITQITDGGAEQIAFIPSPVYRNLYRLADPDYVHQYFVDGSPTVIDAFFDDTSNSWRTVLVGGLAGGGQGIYALDVTDTSRGIGGFSTTNAANLVLWEFTDADDADLGYTFSKPAIIRMHNGEWAVVVGNGLNNTDADGNASGSGDASLFIIDIETGNLIKKISTGQGIAEDPAEDAGGASLARPNGLATPTPVDLDGDYIADYIYAGDLFGNMWKFDVTSSSVSNWNIAQYGGVRQPLFMARAPDGTPQPITTKPEVGVGPIGQSGVMVYFGTGKYVEVGDGTSLSQTTQTFYGLWDQGGVITARSNLQQQSIEQEVHQTFVNKDNDGNVVDTQDEDVRVTSAETVEWKSVVNSSGKLGWYLDLIVSGSSDNQGERQVSDSILRNNRIIFSTLVPSEDQCDFGGTSWLMELDAFSGAKLPFSPFDLNLDGTFDSDDYACTADCGDPATAVKSTVSGKKSKVGIMPTPGILSGGSSRGIGLQSPDDNPDGEKIFKPCERGAECKIASGSGGDLDATRENPGKGDFGRQSWRELR